MSLSQVPNQSFLQCRDHHNPIELGLAFPEETCSLTIIACKIHPGYEFRSLSLSTLLRIFPTCVFGI
ncbi:hypothetical protein ACFLVS_06015, partial [Chloroflexota bacterium]